MSNILNKNTKSSYVCRLSFGYVSLFLTTKGHQKAKQKRRIISTTFLYLDETCMSDVSTVFLTIHDYGMT